MRPGRLTSAATGAVALLIALLVVVDVGWLQSLDRFITDALHGFALDHPWWVRLMTWWSIVFHPTTWRIAAAVLVAWLLHRGDRLLAWWAAATMIAGGILGVLLKLLFGRHRPDLLDPVARAAGYSFPSGHALTNTLGAAVFLTVLLPYAGERPLARRLLWACAVVIPLVTGLSRVALGVHWTSDVVAGWLLGVAIAVGTRAAFLAYAHRATRNPPAVSSSPGEEAR